MEARGWEEADGRRPAAATPHARAPDPRPPPPRGAALACTRSRSVIEQGTLASGAPSRLYPTPTLITSSPDSTSSLVRLRWVRPLMRAA